MVTLDNFFKKNFTVNFSTMRQYLLGNGLRINYIKFFFYDISQVTLIKTK